MPENVMLNHNYVMAEGGTGVRALLAAYMYLSAKAYAAGENGRTEDWIAKANSVIRIIPSISADWLKK